MRLRDVGFLLILVGLVLIVTGVAINFSFHGTSSITVTTTEVAEHTHYQDGLYVTIIPSNMTRQETTMNVFSNFTGPINVTVLIPVKYISNLNMTVIHNYGIEASQNVNGNIYFNTVPPGSCAFAESVNNCTGMIIEPEVPLEISGITFPGAILLFVGFVVVIVSLFDRTRHR